MQEFGLPSCLGILVKLYKKSSLVGSEIVKLTRSRTDTRFVGVALGVLNCWQSIAQSNIGLKYVSISSPFSHLDNYKNQPAVRIMNLAWNPLSVDWRLYHEMMQDPREWAGTW